MTWSLAIAVRGKAQAKRAVDKRQDLPIIIKALIADAITGITDNDDSVIMIEGNGHQADGASWNVSQVNLKVIPIPVQGEA